MGVDKWMAEIPFQETCVCTERESAIRVPALPFQYLRLADDNFNKWLEGKYKEPHPYLKKKEVLIPCKDSVHALNWFMKIPINESIHPKLAECQEDERVVEFVDTCRTVRFFLFSSY